MQDFASENEERGGSNASEAAASEYAVNGAEPFRWLLTFGCTELTSYTRSRNITVGSNVQPQREEVEFMHHSHHF